MLTLHLPELRALLRTLNVLHLRTTRPKVWSAEFESNRDAYLRERKVETELPALTRLRHHLLDYRMHNDAQAAGFA
jgi:hypothetical protein